ncbi:unnamed protein product [Discula destructiva]
MMKSGLLALGIAAIASAVDHGSTYGGSGPYKSYYFEDAGLVNHTLYQPLQSAFGTDSLKLPVIVWGNGACAAQGLKFRGFLGEIASQGALLIATGAAFTDPETATADAVNATAGQTDPADATVLAGENPQALVDAVDWVVANAGKGLYAHVDASRIAVWGQSCGGLEAYHLAQDPRVNHLAIFNSGQLVANASEAVADSVTKPIFYFLGGPTDIAYANGELDYSNLPATTPAFLSNHALGHSAGFDSLNAGIVGVAGTHLMQWLLQGNETAKAWFTEGGWNTTGFVDAASQNLDVITVSAII